MFNLNIKTDNDAFSGGWAATECARILRNLADQLEAGETSGVVRDINGNSVGSFTLKTPKGR